MMCSIEHAYVRSTHWNGNGLLASVGEAPILKFVGSKKFAYMFGESPQYESGKDKDEDAWCKLQENFH
jgi:hypothetical protein